MQISSLRVRRGFRPGRGFIAGQAPGLVTVAGSPASREVRALDRKSGLLLSRTRSAADGTYVLNGLDPRFRYTVIAFDHTETFNAVIRDNITPAEA